MPKKLVLCVDDEAIILLSLKAAMKAALGPDYAFETALSAEEALAFMDALGAEGAAPDLIVSDWRMPGMGGEGFLREARRRLPTAPLMVLSGYAERDHIRSLSQELCLAACFQKPCPAKALAQAIRAATGGDLA